MHYPFVIKSICILTILHFLFQKRSTSAISRSFRQKLFPKKESNGCAEIENSVFDRTKCIFYVHVKQSFVLIKITVHFVIGKYTCSIDGF